MDEPGRFERSMRESTPGTTPLRSRARNAGPTSRRVLLLTSGLGYGHRRASDAIKQALAELSPESVTCDLDFWSLMNPGVAGSIQQMYLQVVQRHSALYDRVYALDEHTWRRIVENDMEPPPEVLEMTEVILASRNASEDIRKCSARIRPTWCCSRLPVRPCHAARSAGTSHMRWPVRPCSRLSGCGSGSACCNRSAASIPM